MSSSTEIASQVGLLNHLEIGFPKLEAVAAEFRKASHAQMSATTQRTIRENVNVTAQVMQLSEKAAELSYDNDNLQVSC